MKFSWLTCVFPIASIFSFRMMGLFMLIPVFTLYASDYQSATPALIGLALGAYGLGQGVFQIPFGLFSDRWGRKPVIAFGLLLLALGSLLGAQCTTIYGMIGARFLQGVGAVGSVLIALLADLTPDNQRTKSMAVIGLTIGLSFSLAMVISPMIAGRFGLAGVFYFTSLLSLAGIVMLYAVIPEPEKEMFHADAGTNTLLLRGVFSNPHLRRLNIGIFCQHFILTATFYELPLLLKQQITTGNLHYSWQFYLPLMVVSFILMVPLIILAEKKQWMRALFLASILISALGQLGLVFVNHHWFGLCLLSLIYFIAFNFLEATLPSLISRQADPGSKGTAMGIYSTFQFMGIFLGGAIAGLVYTWTGPKGLFLVNSLFAFAWLLSTWKMQPNLYITTLSVSAPKGQFDQNQIITKLKNLEGVLDLLFSQTEGTFYIRINKALYKQGSAESLLSDCIRQV